MGRKERDPRRENRRQMKHRAHSAERKRLVRSLRQKPQVAEAAAPEPVAAAADFDINAVILELIDPFLASASDVNEAEIAVLLGITAWNFTNLPPEEGRRLVEGTAMEVAERGQQALKSYAEAIASLILRKQMLFAQLDTVIVDYSIRRTEQGFELAIHHVPPLRR